MARRSPVKVGLALALLYIVGNGQADDTCRTGCRGASQTFKYREGTTYKYNFDSKIEVGLSTAEGQKSLTEVKATVLLTQQPECNQVLRLQNVQVIGSDGKRHSNIPDVEKPIQINFHDGHLEDSICITPGDTQNSLNLKRAIASILQANLKNGHETDVFGLCPTEVSHHKDGNILVVQKVRNLNRCSYRENIKQDFFATSFNPNSEIKSSPILNGDYDAKLRIKNGILDQATIREHYLYVPFSVGSNGAKASVETVLKYVGTAKDNAGVQCSQPRSIIFEDPHPVNSPYTSVNSILTAVKHTAKTIDITVGENTAAEFTNLVRILRVSKKDDLLAVYNQVRAGVGFADKVSAKKLFLDALLRAGNGDNLEVVIELLKNKELSSVEQNLVYLGLSTVRHPTEGSLNSAASLLNNADLPRSAYLGIGNLAGRYCRLHSCKNVDAVNKLTQKLLQKLGNGKATNREQENDIIYVLKALGNIHQLSDAVVAKLTAIAQDKKASTRLRVTALEAYLADACNNKLRDSALNILKDIQQDSEIRIKAYLAAAQCPTSKVGNAVKALLENEPSYQVGGYIVTHIRNLRSSANPDKQLAKQHLGLINIPKRFPVDLRKYSANGEFSYSIDSLGVANSIETNVIYSQNSFLPRSTSLNLTADVFGHSLNFLEIETRQENLDRLVEHYLGPRGLFRAKSLQELWDNKGKHAKEVADDFRQRLTKTLRERRDVTKAEVDHIGRQVQIKTNDLNKNLDLDLKVKTFGSEVVFLNVNDDIDQYTPEAIVNKIVNEFQAGLDKIKHFEETLRSNLLFLDAEFAYPTSFGFPLRLSVEGSSNIQVKAAGDLDLKSFLSSPESELKLKLIPSASVEVAGRLTVDTLVIESGLKTVSTLHTATGGDLIVKFLRNSIDVKFSLPVEKQDLVTATHNIVFYTREWGALEVSVPLKFAQNKDFSICLDQLSSFIGLTFCGEFTGPNLQGEQVPILPFPLSGDGKVAITIEREDLSLYHYKEVRHNVPGKFGVEYTLEAIGKNGQKKVSLDVGAFLAPEKVIRATLTSPIITASAEGRIITSDNEKSVSLRFVQDKNEYYAKLGIGIQGSSAKSIYKPILEYKTPEDSALQVPPYRVEGQLIVEHKGPGTFYTFDNVRLVSPNQKTVSINGKLGHEPDTLSADITVSDGTNSASFDGKLHVTGALIKYSAEVKNTVNPQINVQLKGEHARKEDELKHFFQLKHGGDFSNKHNILTLENSIKYRNKGPQDFLSATKNKVTYPAAGVDLKFEYELKPKAVEYELDIQYGSVKFGSELEWEHNVKREGTEFKLEFGAWGLNNRVYIKSKRRLIGGGQCQIDNSVEVNGKRVEVNGKVKHNIRPHDIDIAADLIVKVPTHSAPFEVVSGLKVNPNEIDASHKVTCGGTVYVDIFLKANRGGNANGAIKVDLKDQLVVNGQLKASRGSGNGEIVIELPAAGRVSKIDSTFTIHEPKYNIIINIYPIFNQDKSKKVTLSTHNSITQQSLDSKNLIDVFGEKLEANIKCTQIGEVTNGKTTSEVEVTLPNQQYLAAKLNREFKNVNNVINGNGIVSLEHRHIKNQPGSKITLKGQVRNTNYNDNVYDVEYQLAGERANGQNLIIDLGLKRAPVGDGYSTIEITNKIHGSGLASPVETIITGKCNGILSTYQAKSSYAPLGAWSVSGKLDRGDKGPASGDIIIDLTSTSKALQSLKIAAAGSVLKANIVDIKGKLDVTAQDHTGVILDLSSNGEVKATDKEVRLKGSVKSGKIEPISIDTGFSTSENKGEKQVGADLTLLYGQNQKIKSDLTLIKLPAHEYKLDVKVDTTGEKFKNNRLQVHTKRNDDNSRYQSEIVLTSDGKTWTSSTDLVLSEIAPSVDIKVKCPEGKLRQVLAKITKMSDSELGAQLKLVNQKTNFLLEGTIDANVETIENFHVKITANSPTLKIDKYVIEAQNKPAKAGRRIQVTAKSGNKNILAGSTSYTAREEHGKLIVEGSGSFKVRDATKSANFKYIRQNLSQAKNGETGIEISFDAGLGNQAIDAELKATNKQFRILNSYCEEKKQCAHVEIDVKTTADDVNYFNQEIEIAVDLRKLGLSHEFGLKAVTTRKEYILDHTVDVHFQSQENSKYQYSLYLHPKEAGVSLTTPKRVISLEANINVPASATKTGGNGGRISGEIVLYIDKKNQPNKKSGLIGFVDLNRHSRTVVGEARFVNPELKRPLIVGFQSSAADNHLEGLITLDVFAQPDQKVTISYSEKWTDLSAKQFDFSESFEIKSSGLGINTIYEEYSSGSVEEGRLKFGSKLKFQGARIKYDTSATFDYNPKNLQILLRILNTDLFKLNSEHQLSQNHHIINSEISYYGHRPLVSHLEIKNCNTLKYTLARKDNPGDKLQINSGLIPGQIADFRAEIIKGGASHELGHATVKLDDANFLKSDYNVQSQNIEQLLLKPIKEGIQKENNELKHLSEEWSKNIDLEVKHLSHVFENALPRVEPVRNYYVSELQKIKQEILADKTVGDIVEFLQHIVSAIEQAFGESIRQFSDLVENVARGLVNSFGKVIEVIEKELFPRIKEITGKILHLIIDVIESGTEIVLTIGVKAAEIAEKYKPELQQIATSLGDISQGFLRGAVRVYEALVSVIIEQWQQIYHEIKSLPAVEQLRIEYERFVQHGLPAPDSVANTIKDLLSTVRDIAPTEELKALVQAISDYITLKLTNRQADDKAAIEKIVKAAVASIDEIIKIITGDKAAPELPKGQLPLPGNVLNKLPRLAAVRLSPLTYLLGEDVAILTEALASLVNKPRNWLPPFPLYGVVAQGQHIFTFDGKHLTFPGTCNYLLARDAVDGNFTIIGSYSNGLLEAISLTQGSDTITLKKHGLILVNNAPSELPARKPNIAAYRDNEKIVLVSEYGVQVVCGPELFVCGVTTSGFYHGKLKGLLGNGNNEPYDDFTLPNGKIVSSESEFGNSYKTSAKCAPVETVSHHGHHASTPACEKLFGWESSLRFCYPFVKTDNYKLACEHGLAAGVQDTEHAIAVAYVAACNQHGIPVRVPSQFVQCTNGEKPTNVGDQFSVKTPGNAADIVVLVDTRTGNEATYKEYVQPLIQQLTTELQTKGIGDVEFHIIAYDGENLWPSHITSSGGKLTFKGKAPNLKFSDGPKVDHLQSGCRPLDLLVDEARDLENDLRLALGLDIQALTYNEGLSYPFRAHAIKSIIAVTGAPCEVGRFYPLQLLRTLLYRGKTINLNLITRIDGVKPEGKNIVGFNSRNVFALGATKNKVKYFSDLNKELTYRDYCIDFTVQNDGNVFVSDHFHLQPKPTKRQFIQVTSHGIVDQLVGAEKGYDCECKFVSPYSATNVCKLVSSKEKPQGRKVGTKS